ncbi:hypothetical protein AGOR_G00212680 [Albula goreensis]|uniref:C2H2-type domain-containing protein n=1 Tax=Albula goreensis TaxID=1534307 RepID=A0A8T3CR75_9TELE|nr:hypothetical protein AGOR_G00212680 [Albula goreensis]
MDKERFAVGRGPCSWLEMHQFIGDLMTSTSAQPVKDAAQQDALRTAWETAGHEALGLKIAPAATPAQNRQPHNKVPAGYSLQPLTEPVDRTGEVVTSAQQLQHRTCTCPACPFSSSFSSSSSPSFQTLRSSRDAPSLQTNPAQSKESTAGPVSLGLCLGLGLNLEDEAGDSTANVPLLVLPPRLPDLHPAPPAPAGDGCPLRPHYHHHHHHHCALMSCLPCPQLPHPAQNPPPFPCLSCQRTFQTCAQLLRHQQGHIQPDGPAQHPCMHCPASFPRPSQLLQHQRSQHSSKVGGFLCTECGRAFNSHSNLRIHLNVHTGARPYTCGECGKSFSQSGALKIHRRIHTGERPYTCEFCGRGFPHLAGVRAHQRTHTGEKPYRCPQCGKCFTQSGALKIHMRIHTGERPFVCGLCGKGFSNRAGIRFHHRTVHGVVSEASLSLAAASAVTTAAHSGLSLLSSAVADAIAGPASGALAWWTAPRVQPPASARTPPTAHWVTPTPTWTRAARGPPSGPLDGLSSRGGKTEVPPQGRPPGAGKDRKGLLPYACEDCGRRFRDAPSRNKHQELEHYPDPEDQEEGLDPDKDGGLEEAVEGMM